MAPLSWSESFDAVWGEVASRVSLARWVPSVTASSFRGDVRVVDFVVSSTYGDVVIPCIRKSTSQLRARLRGTILKNRQLRHLNGAEASRWNLLPWCFCEANRLTQSGERSRHGFHSLGGYLLLQLSSLQVTYALILWSPRRSATLSFPASEKLLFSMER